VRRPVVKVAGALLALVAPVACGTGARPTLGASVPMGGGAGSTLGDAPTDAVLQRLEQVAGHTFTATYRLLRKFGTKSTTATVVEDAEQVSVTVGDVRFLFGSRTVTCSMASGQCEDGTIDARISDYSLPSSFFAESPARALRVTYARKTGDTVAADQTIAGVPSICVEIPIGDGSERYCATSTGAIAQWDTAAIHVELTELKDTADPTAFEVPA
jgi:hypothetical protein